MNHKLLSYFDLKGLETKNMKLIHQPLKRGTLNPHVILYYSYSRDKSFTPLLLLHMGLESSSPNCISQNRMRLIN